MHEAGVQTARGVQPAVEDAINGRRFLRARTQQHRAQRGRQGQRHQA